MDDRRIDATPDALSEAARALPREIAPRRDLWPELRAQLEREGAPGTIALRPTFGGSRSATWLGWMTAAAAAVLIVAGVTRMGTDPTPRDGVTPSGALVATFDRLESQCSELERIFTEETSAGGGAMSPETAATVEAALAVIRTALDESRDALRQHPDDEALARRVVDDYTDRLALARRAARMAAPDDTETSGETPATGSDDT